MEVPLPLSTAVTQVIQLPVSYRQSAYLRGLFCLTANKQLPCCRYCAAHTAALVPQTQIPISGGRHSADCKVLICHLLQSYPQAASLCQPALFVCRHGKARGASQVIEALRQVILHLYDAYLAPDGKAVNYKSLAKVPTFKDYVNATAELQKVRRLLGALQ